MSWLVDDWKQAWRWSSVRLHLAVLLLSGALSIMPELDPAIAGMFPKALQSPIIGIYAIVALLFRVTKLKSGG